MTKYRLRLTNLGECAWIASARTTGTLYMTFIARNAKICDTLREATDTRRRWERFIPGHKAVIEEVTE